MRYSNAIIKTLIILAWIIPLSSPWAQAQQIDEDLIPGAYQLQQLKRPDSLFMALKKQTAEASAKGNFMEQGIGLKQMGELCFHLGHYQRALEYYLEAGKIFEQKGDLSLLAENYLQLGTLQYYNRDTLQSGKSYRQAMRLFESQKNTPGIAATLAKIGHLLEKKGQYQEAFDHQQRAMRVYSSINDKAGLAKTFENLGSIHEDLGNYDKAMQYFQSALSNYEQLDEQQAVIEVINNIGDVFRKTNNYPKALEQYFAALKLSQAQNEMYQINSAYRDLAKTYHLMGKNDRAYEYGEMSRSCLLSIYSMEGNKQMTFIQALNDVEKKNNEIRDLQNAKKVNLIVTIATVIVILLLVFSVFLILSRQRIKLENLGAQKQLMEAELKNRKMEETQLKLDIEIKSKELSTQVLHVIQKNQLLENLKSQLEEILKDEKRDQKKQLRHVIQQINLNFNNDSYWLEFRQLFEQIHHSFFDNLNRKFPGLTATDLKLISLLKMNMDSADMAAMLAISQDSLRIARYRLRKKLDLDQGENLVAFLQSI